MATADFDGTSDYLIPQPKLTQGAQYIVVFKKPLTKKQWRKMCKKYNIVIASRIWK